MKSMKEQFDNKEGWINYTGNVKELSLDPYTLVFCKLRDGYEYTTAKYALCFSWYHNQLGSDIIAYKIYKEGAQLEQNNNNTNTTKQSDNSIEQIIKEYFEIKETIETKQKELDVLKDSLDTKYNELVEKGKSLNVSISIIDNNETTKTEELVITDWRDLKVGDIIWWSGDSEYESGVYNVIDIDYREDYSGNRPFKLDNGSWPNIKCEDWSFVSRPS